MGPCNENCNDKCHDKCDAKAKFIHLIIFTIIILIMPILAIKVQLVKDIVLALFNNKGNAIVYLEFCGAFLGTIVAISGVFIGIDYMKCRKKFFQDTNTKLIEK